MPEYGREETTENVFVSLGTEDLEYAKSVATKHGVTIEADTEDGLLDPGTLTVLLMGGSLAVSTVVYLLDKRRGGQIIDLRPNADPIARRDKGLQFGLVTLIAPDGQVLVTVKEPRGMYGQVLDTLRSTIVDLAGLPAPVVSDRVKDVVGELATTKVIEQ